MTDRQPTTRVACDECGVVQEVEITRETPENFPDVPGVSVQPRTDEECAVCESPLSLDQPRGGILS